jgi:hypothetical protein
MKVVIPGGSGEVGAVLRRWLVERGHEVVILSRSAPSPEKTNADYRVVQWDGERLGAWADELDGADVCINLAGRSVNCRYTEENMRQMMDSRVNSTRVVGEAIAAASDPPEVWLQMSTATIYAHRFDAANDEETGIIGGDEPDVPDYWGFSVEIAKRWEQMQREASTPDTRKVALRTAMVMSPSESSVFGMLLRMTRLGLGGPIGGGEQYVSWIHERDFCRAVQFLIENQVEGPINLAAPQPQPQRQHMRILRDAAGVSIGLPATEWMASIGAFFLRTDTELILKSRRVVPGRLREEGFEFAFSEWADAAEELVARS